MDPHTGRVFNSAEEARANGVKNTVEISGHPDDIRRISKAVKAMYRQDERKKKQRRKKSRDSRKANR